MTTEKPDQKYCKVCGYKLEHDLCQKCKDRQHKDSRKLDLDDMEFVEANAETLRQFFGGRKSGDI